MNVWAQDSCREKTFISAVQNEVIKNSVNTKTIENPNPSEHHQAEAVRVINILRTIINKIINKRNSSDFSKQVNN